MAENIAETILGGFTIGVLVSCILYGISTMQAFIYYKNYPEDTLFLKLAVAVIYALETLHMVLSIDALYAYAMRHFGDTDFTLKIYWSVGVTVIIEIVVATLVEGFLIRRIWILSKGAKLVVCILSFLILIRLALGIATVGISYGLKTWPELGADNVFRITMASGMGPGVIGDLGIAAMLCYYLSRGRSELPKETQNTINLIMLYAVNSGAITGASGLCSFVLGVSQRSNVTFLGVLAIQSRLYSNSFLGSLNARSYIRNMANSYGSSGSSRISGRVSTAKFNVVRTADLESSGTTVQGGDEVGMASANDYRLQDIKGNELA